MIRSTFELEKELSGGGYEMIIGIDEAGRGPLAGPVVAGAVVLKCHPEFISGSYNHSEEMLSRMRDQHDNIREWDLVRDSKTLSEKQREKVFDFIMEKFHVGIGICDHSTIDRINILEASFLAMKKAVVSLNLELKTNNEKQQLKTKNYQLKNIILLDGNKEIPNFSGEQRAIVNGDKLVKSISAASIIAKVTRDRMMLELHAKYPEYGFDKHKGYGTKFHMDALEKHGPSEIHRRSFAPVKKCLK